MAYRLAGPDAVSFDIDAATGQLKTKAGVNYDYETRTLYTVRVTATDPTNAKASITVTIGVTDEAEKPATPAPPRVRPLGDSHTILRARWLAPSRNGGPPIIGYDLEYRPGSSGEWNPWPHWGTRTTRLITRLQPGTVYQVRVRALNGEIPSDWSAPGTGRTKATVKGWLARFARTVAQGMLEGVEDRLRSPRQIGMRARLGPHELGAARDASASGADYGLGSDLGPAYALSSLPGGDAEAAPSVGHRLLAEGQLVSASAFEASGEMFAGGVFGLWGRGRFARFDGLEGRTTLDGDVTTGTVGADYVRGPWLAGLALSHSSGVGGYGGAHSPDDIEALLTGLYPYAGYRVTDRLSIWGVGGHGQGLLRRTPGSGRAMETNIGLTMAALGARGLLVGGVGGPDLALRTDGFWVRATSEGHVDLIEADVRVTRLRLAVESTYPMDLENGAKVTPQLEFGVRQDDGDAETGFGADIGGGLVWLAPARGISLEVKARSLIGHEAERFRDWGLSGLVRYDPDPVSDRGPSAFLRSSVGSARWGGADTLLQADTLAAIAAQGAVPGGQLSVEAAYGLPLLGGQYTGSPWVGAGVLQDGHDYRVGYRISPARQSHSAMHLGIEGVRRDSNGGDEGTEYAVALRIGSHW